jgi:ketosteroid isomerase-like protein
MKNPKSILRCAFAMASVIALVGLSAFAENSRPTATLYANDETAVRDALLKFARSIEQNDIGMASQVWANDDSLIVFESGNAHYGWKNYRDRHLIPAMSSMKNTRVGINETKIHPAGKTAWATFKYTISADRPGNGTTRHIDFIGIATALLERRDGRWQIVHWHTSAPASKPTKPE